MGWFSHRELFGFLSSCSGLFEWQFPDHVFAGFERVRLGRLAVYREVQFRSWDARGSRRR
jgi:hypothetical protein